MLLTITSNKLKYNLFFFFFFGCCSGSSSLRDLFCKIGLNKIGLTLLQSSYDHCSPSLSRIILNDFKPLSTNRDDLGHSFGKKMKNLKS